MHDAVARRDHIGTWECLKPPCQHAPKGLGMKGLAIAPCVLMDRRAAALVHFDVALLPGHFYETNRDRWRIPSIKFKECELDRGRA
jgi:hypothetical protein